MEKNEIMLIHGKDYLAMTKTLLERADLAGEIGDKRKRVAMKPNLVVGGRAEQGAVTHPEILSGVIEYLQEHGFQNLQVMEGSWVGARTMPAAREAGLLDVCQKYGVPFVDLQADSSHEVKAADMKLHVCDEINKIDFLINLPVLKGHCQTMLTCALKNMKGVIPNTEKRRFHTLGLHRPIAHLALAVKQNFIVVDNICGDLDFEEGGTPVPMDRIFCCKDPVLCDAFGCKTMGLALEDVPYIQMAEKLGAGTTDLTKAKIIPLNDATIAQVGRGMSRRVRELSGYIAPKDACSACYGMLIHALDKLDRQGLAWGHQQKICIGQGYQGVEGEEIGVGKCTKGCLKSLIGCPPTAEKMMQFLEENWI